MKRFGLGVIVGGAVAIGGLYLYQFAVLSKFRLQMALQKQGEEDFRRAFPDAGRALVSVQVEGKDGETRLTAGRDGEYVVNFEYLRACVFKEIHLPYQVTQGKVRPATNGALQRLDAAARPVARKGCQSGAVASQ